jgi:hypothetical protein
MMNLALVVSLAIGQICNVPTGIARFEEPVCASASTYDGRIIFNDTADCLAFADGGQWKCLLEADQAAASAQGTELRSSAPSAPSPGRTYFDTTKGCQQTWTGAAWVPAQCPISNAPNQPTTPNTLASPSASAPSGTFPAGTGYYNTSCKRILTFDGTTWEQCPVNVATAMAQNSNAPTLPSGQASANRGNVYFDTTLGCTRATRDGLNWGPCLTTQVCVPFSVSGLSIPALGVSTAPTLVTFPGALSGSPCHVTRSSGAVAPTGSRGDCFVTATPNQVSVQWISNTGLLSAVVSIPNGTYNVCSEVIW